MDLARHPQSVRWFSVEILDIQHLSGIIPPNKYLGGSRDTLNDDRYRRYDGHDLYSGVGSESGESRK